MRPLSLPAGTEGPSEPAAGARFEVEVAGGQPAGDVQRFDVELGSDVTLVVTTDDTSDHVHVHSYDRFADLAPGQPAELSSTADIPGAFEIELEDAHVKIAELQVR